MKRVAVMSVALLAAATLLTGCQKEEVEKLVAPLVADVQETPEAQEMKKRRIRQSLRSMTACRLKQERGSQL